MKRILTLEICMLVVLFLPLTANATGGGLRKNSIKTCPNGVTYGRTVMVMAELIGMWQ